VVFTGDGAVSDLTDSTAGVPYSYWPGLEWVFFLWYRTRSSSSVHSFWWKVVHSRNWNKSVSFICSRSDSNTHDFQGAWNFWSVMSRHDQEIKLFLSTLDS